MTRFHFSKREEPVMIRFHRPDSVSGCEHSDRAPHRAQHRRRELSLRLLGFALALVVCLLVAGYPPSGGITPAHADATCNITLAGSFIACPAPPLLNEALLSPSRVGTGDLYAATPAQQQSLANLEQQAVQATIHDHGLASSDATAVQTWARDDADAELWALIVNAISLPKTCTTGQTPGKDCRNADQQNAVDWLTAVQQRENGQAAQDAGLEYVKWAGLSQKYYQSLIASGADETTLENFLKGTPVNYNLIDSNGNPINAGSPTSGINLTAAGQSTGGYCVYRSPAHDYSTVYNNNIFQDFDTTHSADSTCYAPCPTANCPVTPPSYNNFVEWGATDAADSDFSAPDFGYTAQNIGTGVGVGLAVAAAIPLTIILANAGVAGLLGLGALSAAGTGAATTGITVGLVGAFSTAATVFAAVAIMIVFVVIAVVTAIIYTINFVNALELPRQLALLIALAPTAEFRPDLGAILSDSKKAPTLYSLFVGATLPRPSSTSCDNAQQLDPSGPPCLNAPPVPSSAPSDPQFAIQQQGATTTTDTSSISWKDTTEPAANNTTTSFTSTGRLSGNWFVDQVTDSGGNTTTSQSLRIEYTDWAGKDRTAYLFDFPGEGYKFLGFATPGPNSPTINWSTCKADGTCSYSPTIDYVGTDGKKYAATVVPPPVPQVTPTFDANPVEGSPVNFHANGSSPDGSALTYQWKFQEPASNSCLSGCTNFTAPISGDPVSHTWPISGTFQVQVTATNAQNLSTTDTFTVSVGHVSPTLALWPTCPTNPSSCDQHAVPLHTSTPLDGTITHAGSGDAESVTVNWGDGHADSATIGGTGPQNINTDTNITLTASSGTAITLGATHTYGSPGAYTVTVTVTDQAGGTDSTTFTENVQDLITLTWPQPQPITYGTPLGASQLDASASATASPTVPGTFAYYNSANYNSADLSPVTTGQVLPAGSHTLWAVFTPSNPDLFTFPQFSITPTVNLMVNQAPLTITAGSPSTVYTGTVPAVTPGYSGFVNKESADALTTKPSCTSTAPSSGAVGSYATSCSGAVDPNYQFSYVPGTMTITKAATSLSLGSSGSPVMQGNAVTFTATVAVTAPGAGTPTGTVTFKDGSTTLGTGQLSVVNGQDQATFSTSGLGLGQHTITASYGGDGNFTGSSTSSSLTQNIDTNLSRYPKLSSGAYNLSNANLSGGYFAGDNLAGASLTGSNLTNAVFTNANLTGANLSNSNYVSGANFTGANLSNANLSNSNLKGANFTNVNLSGANLTGSNLKGATGLKTATLTNVIWSNTACPDGSNSSSDGGTCVGHL